MSRGQQVKIVGVLVLVLGAMSITAAGALGLVDLRPSGEIEVAMRWAAQVMPWARLGLGLVLAGWVMAHQGDDADQRGLAKP
jgi:hypothetical protein